MAVSLNRRAMQEQWSTSFAVMLQALAGYSGEGALQIGFLPLRAARARPPIRSRSL